MVTGDSESHLHTSDSDCAVDIDPTATIVIFLEAINDGYSGQQEAQLMLTTGSTRL